MLSSKRLSSLSLKEKQKKEEKEEREEKEEKEEEEEKGEGMEQQEEERSSSQLVDRFLLNFRCFFYNLLESFSHIKGNKY